MRASVAPVKVIRMQEDVSSGADDIIVVEEPLEIRLGYGPTEDRKEIPLSVTMRTPGNDAELAVGFLYTEGIVKDPAEVVRVVPCQNVKAEERGNVVRAELHPSVELDPARWQRNFYTSSSCGVCGKSSIDAVHAQCDRPLGKTPSMGSASITALPERMHAAQTLSLIHISEPTRPY